MTVKTKERIKFAALLAIIGVVFIILPYFFRKDEAKGIKAHSKFALGKIIRKSSTLKSGDYWHYQFKYKENVYENSRATHVNYDVDIGDYFLVNFSSKNPENSKILYEYKLNADKLNYVDSLWDTIPQNILHSSLKK